MKTDIGFGSCLAEFILEWEMLQTKVVENIRIHISPPQSYNLWDNMEKYGRAGQGTDDNMAHAHCMLDT